MAAKKKKPEGSARRKPATREEAPIDAELAELRKVPPKQFTRARNERAQALREEGADAAAKALKKVAKPSPSVWAANALARESTEEVERLLDAGAALRLAQRKTLSGAGDSAAMREALRAYQQEVGRATEAGMKLLRTAGESTSAAMKHRLRETLFAAAGGEREVRDALRNGALEQDLVAAGFGEVTPLRVVKGSRSGGERKGRAADRKTAGTGAASAGRTKATAREERAAREEAAARRKAIAHAKKALQIAEREHARLEHLAAEAEARATDARRATIDAEKRVEAARREVETASRE